MLSRAEAAKRREHNTSLKGLNRKNSHATELLGCAPGLRAKCVAAADCNADLVAALNGVDRGKDSCLRLSDDEGGSFSVARTFALLPSSAPPSADVVASLAGVGVRRPNGTNFNARPPGASRLFYGLVNFLELMAAWPTNAVDVNGNYVGTIKAKRRALNFSS